MRLANKRYTRDEHIEKIEAEGWICIYPTRPYWWKRGDDTWIVNKNEAGHFKGFAYEPDEEVHFDAPR